LLETPRPKMNMVR